MKSVFVFVCGLMAMSLSRAQTFTDITPAGIPGLDMATVSMADYNKDGYVDFALTGRQSNDVPFGAIYTNQGNGNFVLLATSNMPAIRFCSMDWGDYDNDDDLDLLMTGRLDVPPYYVQKILRNDLTSFAQIEGNGDAEFGVIRWVDFDNDGDLDFYRGGYSQTSNDFSTVFFNIGGTFNTKIQGQISLQEMSGVPSDYNNDGWTDMIISGGTQGTFQMAAALTNKQGSSLYHPYDMELMIRSYGAPRGSTSVADFDGNGKWDYLMTGDKGLSSQNNGVAVILQNLTRGVSIQTTNLPGVYYSSSDVGDIDNDGDVDIILTGRSGTGIVPVTRVYLSQGNFNFTELTNLGLDGIWWGTVQLGELDNDGDLDIILTGKKADGTNITKLYRNDLVSKVSAPNIVPSIPQNPHVVSVGNNSVVFAWNPATDTETPQTSVSYNIALGQASLAPSAFMPDANMANGFRRVARIGNAGTSESIRVSELRSGHFYFTVQSIDGSKAGSPFSPEIEFDFVRIDSIGPTCASTPQQFVAIPAGSYTWSIVNGTILSGQGTDHVEVKWNTTATGTITVTKNAISNYLDVVINPLPLATISGRNFMCGLNETFTYVRPAPYLAQPKYQWTLDGVVQGSYTSTAFYVNNWPSLGIHTIGLTETNMLTGCAGQGYLDVDVSAIPLPAILKAGDTLYSVNRKPTFTYEWIYRESPKPPDVVGTNEYHVAKKIGLYELRIANEYACSDGFASITVTKILNPITGIEPAPLTAIRAYPNPVTSQLNFMNLPSNRRTVIRIHDMMGRLVYSNSYSASDAVVDCSSLPAGMYFWTIDCVGSVRLADKFVVKR